MATRAVGKVTYGVANRSINVRWDGLLNGDDGAPVLMDDYIIQSIQILGTIGAGFNVNCQGSNEVLDPPVNWGVIAAFSTGIALGLIIPDAATEAYPVNVRNFRPIVTAGDGTTNVSVILQGLRRS